MRVRGEVRGVDLVTVQELRVVEVPQQDGGDDNVPTHLGLGLRLGLELGLGLESGLGLE